MVAARRGLAVCALNLFVATIALADGTYQRTKDGKTIVWNQDPKPGDTATWSGDRDREGYAKGFGTLTWYTARERSGGEPRQTLYASYFGNMVRGKLDGPVNGHSKGVTAHAIFSEGKRTSRWAAGTTPSWRVPRSMVDTDDAEVVTAKTASPTPTEFNPPPPSYRGVVAGERPVPDFNALRDQEHVTAESDVPEEGPALEKSTGGTPPPKLETDHSLRTLAAPPPSLRSALRPDEKPAAGSPGVVDTHLSKEEVIQRADAEAQKRGYSLSDYLRPDPQFDAIDNTWLLFYDRKPVAGAAPPGKHFTVAVDEKTKRAALVPGR